MLRIFGYIPHSMEPLTNSGRSEGGRTLPLAALGDATDFETIALPHLDGVLRAAVALCGDREQADDLVQATYLKAIGRFASFTRGTNCKAWLVRILRNTWIDRLRHRKVTGPAVPLDEAVLAEPDAPSEPPWTDAEDVLERFEDEQVIAALRTLGDDQRLALVLVDVEGMSHADVAEILGVAPGTIKSRTGRARAKLRTLLRAHAHDLGLDGRART